MTINILSVDFTTNTVKKDEESANKLLKYYNTYMNIGLHEFSGTVDDIVVNNFIGERPARLLRFHDDVFTCDDLIIVWEGYSLQRDQISYDVLREQTLAALADLFKVQGEIKFQLSLMGGIHVFIAMGIANAIKEAVENKG